MRGPRVGIVTLPLGEAGKTPMSNLIDIISERFVPIQVVTGNDALDFLEGDLRVKLSGIRKQDGKNPYGRIARNVYMQLRISLLVLERLPFVDAWIFFIGGDGLILPMIAAKLARKFTILALAGSDEQSLRFSNDPFSRLLSMLSRINRILANRLVIYSSNLVREWHLEPYVSKLAIAHHHFVDFGKFNLVRRVGDRLDVIGYVGRMSEEKGALQFAKAVPIAIQINPELRFIMAGEGPLRENVEQLLVRFGLETRVEMPGWVPHGDLPHLLNSLKLIVIPSFTEGLPNIMLEAMACGTPVLATPVGAIRDVIRDGETGFILDDNSPESIASNITRVLEAPDFERVAERAQELVHISFTFERAVDSWRRVLERRYTDSG